MPLDDDEVRVLNLRILNLENHLATVNAVLSRMALLETPSVEPPTPPETPPEVEFDETDLARIWVEWGEVEGRIVNDGHHPITEHYPDSASGFELYREEWLELRMGSEESTWNSAQQSAARVVRAMPNPYVLQERAQDAWHSMSRYIQETGHHPFLYEGREYADSAAGFELFIDYWVERYVGLWGRGSSRYELQTRIVNRIVTATPNPYLLRAQGPGLRDEFPIQAIALTSDFEDVPPNVVKAESILLTPEEVARLTGYLKPYEMSVGQLATNLLREWLTTHREYEIAAVDQSPKTIWDHIMDVPTEG
jgi:hypothetical protein